ncbi:MAG: ABC transporter permease subunit, partial [Gammaproteobacteria bacterium]|nr:ABC transporter permease subunit [Gammaproteobacteria bacterium]
MVDNNKFLDFISHFLLILGALVVMFPLYVTWVASTHSTAEISQNYPMPLSWGGHAWKNYSVALLGGVADSGANISPTYPMLLTSFISALAIAFGKITISVLSAFAIVFFRFPGRNIAFFLIFVTLMLPVEVRISPTYEVVANLGMINTYPGLIIPLIASATATLLYRQFFLTLPKELSEAAKVDGASALRFFKDIVLP